MLSLERAASPKWPDQPQQSAARLPDGTFLQVVAHLLLAALQGVSDDGWTPEGGHRLLLSDIPVWYGPCAWIGKWTLALRAAT
jgi:hypothetical protein